MHDGAIFYRDGIFDIYMELLCLYLVCILVSRLIPATKGERAREPNYIGSRNALKVKAGCKSMSTK